MITACLTLPLLIDSRQLLRVATIPYPFLSRHPGRQEGLKTKDILSILLKSSQTVTILPIDSQKHSHSYVNKTAHLPHKLHTQPSEKTKWSSTDDFFSYQIEPYDISIFAGQKQLNIASGTQLKLICISLLKSLKKAIVFHSYKSSQMFHKNVLHGFQLEK